MLCNGQSSLAEHLECIWTFEHLNGRNIETVGQQRGAAPIVLALWVCWTHIGTLSSLSTSLRHRECAGLFNSRELGNSRLESLPKASGLVKLTSQLQLQLYVLNIRSETYMTYMEIGSYVGGQHCNGSQWCFNSLQCHTRSLVTFGMWIHGEKWFPVRL